MGEEEKNYTAGGGSCVLPFQIGRAGSWSISLEGWPWGYRDVICIALMSEEHWFCQVGRRRRTCMQDMPWPPSHFAHCFLGCDSLDWCTHTKCKLKGSNFSSSLLWTACELSFFLTSCFLHCILPWKKIKSLIDSWNNLIRGKKGSGFPLILLKWE